MLRKGELVQILRLQGCNKCHDHGFLLYDAVQLTPLGGNKDITRFRHPTITHTLLDLTYISQSVIAA